jgi:prefoldin beta subunit
MPEGARDKLMGLQQLQQQLQALTMQKQTIQMQLAEIDNALNELKDVKTEKVYELVGNILVNKKPVDLNKSLVDKKERYDLRIESIEKQLKRVTIKAQDLQKDIMGLAQKGGKKE